MNCQLRIGEKIARSMVPDVKLSVVKLFDLTANFI